MAFTCNTTTSTVTGISTVSEEYWRYMQMQSQAQMQGLQNQQYAPPAMKQEKQEPQPNLVLLLLED